MFEYAAPRDPIVGPGKHVFDLSLGKSFRMPYNEQHTLQFRAEFFNAFNTPQFANPDSSLGDGDSDASLIPAHPTVSCNSV